MIKKLFSVLLFLCLFQSVVYSYTLEVTEWDQTEDTNLKNKLKDSFYSKYCKPPVEYTDENGTFISETHCNFPPDGYYKEVLEQYELNKKKWSEVPKKYYKIETKQFFLLFSLDLLQFLLYFYKSYGLQKL